jgi:hypothetical protein
MRKVQNQFSTRSRRAAAGVLYIVAAVLSCAVLIALGIDFNRVQAAKAPLYLAADAAARAAAARMPSAIDAQRLAIQFALANAGDSTPLSIVADEDVQLGSFDERTNSFKPLPDQDRSAADAVRVTLRRTSARGNAVPLTCAKVIGQNTWDVSVSSIAHAKQRFFGIVGLDGVTLTSDLKLDSYDSGSGAYSAAKAQANVAIASNGPIRRGSVSSNEPQPMIARRMSPAGVVTALGYAVRYDAPEANGIATNNNNVNIPSDYLHDGKLEVPMSAYVSLPAGNYFCKRLDIAAGATLRFTGPATIWIAGDASIRGCIIPSANSPALFKLRVITPSSSMTLAPQTDFYADVYAPLTAISVTGDADFFGGIIGRTVNISGPNNFHFDESLGVNGLWASIELNH